MNHTAAGPTMEDMRDGILDAAAGSGHECLIWEGFADLGIGDGAKGGTNSVTTESFTVPVSCTGGNALPVANPDGLTVDKGETQTVLESGQSSVLDNDYDAEGNPLTAAVVDWPINGSLTLDPDGTFSYQHIDLETSSDSFTYVANDGTADSNIATVLITVAPDPGEAPTADAGPDQALISVGKGKNQGANVTLDGSASTNNVGVTSYSWSWDGGSDSGMSPTVLLSKGTHIITLTVVDDDQYQDSDTVCVEIYKNQSAGTCGALDPAPTAGFTYSANLLVVDFNDTLSDADGTLVSWDWDFGDGNVSTAQNPLHDYDSGGDYLVMLTVTDNDGNFDTTAQTVSVSETGSTIMLSANGFKVKGKQHADLAWSGIPSGDIDIYRDGNWIATVAAGASSYDDNIGQNGGGSYSYHVCEAQPLTDCSNTAIVTF